MTRRTALLWITLSLAGGLLPARAAADVAELHRPILAVWSAQVGPEGTSWCRHCDRFWQDFRENDAFHDALCSRYRVVYINADRRRLEGTLLQGITALPTFTAPGRRIVGYTSPADLLARLELPALAPERQPDRPSFPSLPQSPSAPPAQPPATLPPPAVPQVPDLPDEPPSEEPTTDQKLPEAAAPDERPPARPQAGNREFNAPQSPSVPAQPLPDPAPPAEPADAAVHLPEVDSPGSAPRSAEAPSGGTPADRPASTPAAPSSRKPVELPAVVTWLARPVALYFGGPLAAAAVGAVGWWWGRRQQRRSARPQNH